MEKLTITAIAVALTTILTGCQSLPANQSVFKAPSYYGKEIPSAFYRNHHRLEHSGGHELRGYRFGKRHWFL